MLATPLTSADDALRVQPRTRIPSPPVQLASTDIESLEPGRAGMSAGKRVVIIMGIGAAVAAVIGLFAYAAAAG